MINPPGADTSGRIGPTLPASGLLHGWLAIRYERNVTGYPTPETNGPYAHSAHRGRWPLLIAAILAEVSGTLSLRAAVDHGGWIPVVVVCYVAAFTLIGLTLRTGMKIGVVYDIWSAIGVSLVAALGVIIFGETFSAAGIAGIGIIIAGVVLVETGSGTDEGGTG